MSGGGYSHPAMVDWESALKDFPPAEKFRTKVFISEQPVKCDYCGTGYRASINQKCPSCGARK